MCSLNFREDDVKQLLFLYEVSLAVLRAAIPAAIVSLLGRAIFDIFFDDLFFFSFVVFGLISFYRLSSSAPLNGDLADALYYLIALFAVSMFFWFSFDERRCADSMSSLKAFQADLAEIELTDRYLDKYFDADTFYAEFRERQRQMLDSGADCSLLSAHFSIQETSPRAQEAQVASLEEGGVMWSTNPCIAVTKVLSRSYPNFSPLYQDWLDGELRLGIELIWPNRRMRIPSYRLVKDYYVEPAPNSRENPIPKSFQYLITQMAISADLRASSVRSRAERLQGYVADGRERLRVFQSRYWSFALVLMLFLKLAKKRRFGIF